MTRISPSVLLLFSALFLLTSQTPTYCAAPGATTSTVARKALDLNDEAYLKRLEAKGPWGYQQGYVEEDGVYICDAKDAEDQCYGVVYTYEIDQEFPAPLVATGWSRCENAGGNRDSNYSLYVDLLYDDGTALWGQVYAFPVKTSDWSKGSVTIFPNKPVKSATFYGMFRSHPGKAEFKDLALYQYATDSQTAYFDGNPIEAVDASRERDQAPRVYLRDAANNGDYLTLQDATAASCDFQELDVMLTQEAVALQTSRGTRTTETKLTLQSADDRDYALQLAYSLPFPELDGVAQWVWYDYERGSKPIEYNEASFTRALANAGAQRQSAYPFGVVAAKNAQGEYIAAYGIGLDPNFPASYRIACNGTTRELYVVFDLALTPEKRDAELRVLPLYWEASADSDAVVPVDPVGADRAKVGAVPFGSDPFRACFDVYRQTFPANFFVRALKQGNWMAFAKISNVPNNEDFGFQFKEGVDEIAKDDAIGVSTFRYTEPMTWWQRFENFEGVTDIAGTAYGIAKKEAQENAHNEDGRPRYYQLAEAKSLLTSGFNDVNGDKSGLILDTPWCKGVVWSMNDAPGLVELARQGKLRDAENADVEPVAGFEVKWSEKIADELYPSALDPEATPKTREELLNAEAAEGCDGEYVDSSEGYVTAMLDFNRSHFAGMTTPLVYDADTFKPAILRGLIAFEYVKRISDDVHARAKLSMANATPSLHFWLTTQLDVVGTETNWNHSGGWRPMPDDELMYRRTLCCGKPYCFLMNTDFADFSKEKTEMYMRRAIAYGMFPSFFSADASTRHYFENPELYERDRDLFKRYMPIVTSVAEAGWEPETCAVTNDTKLYLERFGALHGAEVASNALRPTQDVYLTLFNDSEEEKDYEITFGKALEAHISAVDGRVVEMVEARETQLDGNALRGKIGAQDVRVFKIVAAK